MPILFGIYIDHLWPKVFEKKVKNSKIWYFRGNNSYKGLLFNFDPMETFVELHLLIISAGNSFFFIYYSFRDKGQKQQSWNFRGNNSYKGKPYNFIQMKTFNGLDLLIISARKSFSLSITVFGIMSKNCKNRQSWRLKGNNSYKGSLYDFDPIETFVEL